jgi:hypothetical protein
MVQLVVQHTTRATIGQGQAPGLLAADTTSNSSSLVRSSSSTYTPAQLAALFRAMLNASTAAAGGSVQQRGYDTAAVPAAVARGVHRLTTAAPVNWAADIAPRQQQARHFGDLIGMSSSASSSGRVQQRVAWRVPALPGAPVGATQSLFEVAPRQQGPWARHPTYSFCHP